MISAVTPSRKYCYRRQACSGDVIINDKLSSAASYKAERQALIVDQHECCTTLGGFSWGLNGGQCQPCPSAASVQRMDAPDTLQGKIINHPIW